MEDKGGKRLVRLEYSLADCRDGKGCPGIYDIFNSANRCCISPWCIVRNAEDIVGSGSWTSVRFVEQKRCLCSSKVYAIIPSRNPVHPSSTPGPPSYQHHETTSPQILNDLSSLLHSTPPLPVIPPPTLSTCISRGRSVSSMYSEVESER
jgi:hypothetical protein